TNPIAQPAPNTPHTSAADNGACDRHADAASRQVLARWQKNTSNTSPATPLSKFAYIVYGAESGDSRTSFSNRGLSNPGMACSASPNASSSAKIVKDVRTTALP